MDKNETADQLLNKIVQANQNTLEQGEAKKIVSALTATVRYEALLEMMQNEGLVTMLAVKGDKITATDKGRQVVKNGGWLSYLHRNQKFERGKKTPISTISPTEKLESSTCINSGLNQPSDIDLARSPLQNSGSISAALAVRAWKAIMRTIKVLSTNPLSSSIIASCLVAVMVPYFSDRETASETRDFEDERARDWKTLMNFQRRDAESCDYPVMYPDSVFHLQSQTGFAAVPLAFLSDTTRDLPKAPTKLGIFWGFKVPFFLEGKTKTATLAITNRFTVKVYASGARFIHSNAESTCGGEGKVYGSSEKVTLHTRKPYYEQVVSFPQANFFTLNPNEVISFELEFKIENPGNYHVVVEIPYTYRGKYGVASLDLKNFVAPWKFDLWEATFELADSTSFQLSRISQNRWNGMQYDTTDNQKK